MNLLAARERFFVLYPEQDRLAHPQGCWNWYDRRSGKADAEAATLMAALDQACTLYPVDRERVAVAGLSAGASMAALLATRYPVRFKALAMHSGVAPGAAPLAGHRAGARLRGRHVPPMPATAGRQGDGRRGCLHHAAAPAGAAWRTRDVVVSASNAGSTAEVWATATAAKPGAERTLQRGKRQCDARDRVQAQRPHLRDAVPSGRPRPCVERRGRRGCPSATPPGRTPRA
jgi:poly(3-hydroxybutyrate) depolymerase